MVGCRCGAWVPSEPQAQTARVWAAEDAAVSPHPQRSEDDNAVGVGQATEKRCCSRASASGSPWTWVRSETRPLASSMKPGPVGHDAHRRLLTRDVGINLDRAVADPDRQLPAVDLEREGVVHACREFGVECGYTAPTVVDRWVVCHPFGLRLAFGSCCYRPLSLVKVNSPPLWRRRYWSAKRLPWFSPRDSRGGRVRGRPRPP